MGGSAISKWRPLGVAAAGTIAMLALATKASDALEDPDEAFKYTKTGTALLTYALALAFSRAMEQGPHSFYDFIWACNNTMVVAAVGMMTGRPLMVSGAIVPVSADQFMWYADLIGYILTKKFPVGVCKYLLYPENRTVTRWLTSSHHLFFIPLCLSLLSKHGGVRGSSWQMGVVITGWLAVYARMFTPKTVMVPSISKKPILLNTNGAFEFWKDIKIPLFHLMNGKPAPLYLAYLMLIGNTIINGPFYVLMYLLSRGMGWNRK